jgi:hypothetical protein
MAATPTLSDDYYRFYWDGNLINHSIDPYSKKPFEIKNENSSNKISTNFDKLNSKNYYSAYPSFNQFLFFIAAKTNSEFGFILITRILIVLADLIILFLIFKITQTKTLTFNPVIAYGLNPLVITELTGNLHFEGIAMCFWLLAIWLILKQKIIFSYLMWTLAACTKIIPLLLIPALWPFKNIKYAFLVGVSITSIFLISFLIFTNFAGINNFFESISLYYNSFEFNASIYFIAREIGILIKGYNPIAIIGPTLGILFIITAFYIVWHAWKNKISNIFLISTFILLVYYLSATTVHPWYSINLLVPGIIAGLYFPIAWTGLIFLSYVFYGVNIPEINYLFIAIEYSLLFFIIYKDKNRIIQSAKMIF